MIKTWFNKFGIDQLETLQRTKALKKVECFILIVNDETRKSYFDDISSSYN